MRGTEGDSSDTREKAKQAPGLLRSAGIISIATAASRVTGLVRESVLSWLFGASAVFDAYVLGARIPMLTRELFAEGALSSAFLPTFTRYLALQGEEAARELSNITATLLVVIVSLFCALGIWTAPLFVDVFAPAFHAVPGKWELAVSLVRTMFPFLLFVSLLAQAQGILNANHRFGLPAVSSGIFNLASVTAGLLLGRYTPIGAVHGMAVGVLVGGAVQLGALLPSVWATGFAWRPRWDLHHEGVRHILALMAPAILGNASSQINTLVNTNFAAGLRDAGGHVLNGPVSWLSYAFRFLQLPMGLFGVAIASATLPRLARTAAKTDWDDFRETLSRSLVMILLLTLPSAAGLIVLGESMIRLIYEHGRFLPFDTHQTAIALGFYALGLAAASSLKLLVPAFYALQDARTPMTVSLISVAVNAITAYFLIRGFRLGHAALALSAASVSTFTAVTLLLLIRPRIGGVNGKFLLQSFGRIGIASVATGGAAFAVRTFSHSVLSGKRAAAVDVAGGVPAGAIVFYTAALMLRVPELEEVKQRLLRKLR